MQIIHSLKLFENESMPSVITSRYFFATSAMFAALAILRDRAMSSEKNLAEDTRSYISNANHMHDVEHFESIVNRFKAAPHPQRSPHQA